MISIIILTFLTFSAFSQDNETCLSCHSDPELTGTDPNGKEVSMFVDSLKFSQSIHADLSCIDCHQDLEGVEDFPHQETLALVNCGTCHEDEANEYAQSMHGLKFVHREELAPKCWDCHGKHDILPSDNPKSKTYFENLPVTCHECHHRRDLALSDSLHIAQIAPEFLKGVHGKLIEEGNEEAPTCNTCHTSHSIRRRIDPQSTIYKLNIPKTCGQCHFDEFEEYGKSIHFVALSHGILESADCTDCHGEHQIVSPDSAYLIAAHDACERCHNDPRLIRKYGLSQKVVSTYEDSYHGLAVKLGQKKAPTCASCHRHHEIYGPKNPLSSVNKENLVKTCSQCHKNVTESFAKSYTHESMLIRSNPINYWISLIYISLIVVVIGGMFFHNLIIFLRYIRYKRLEEKHLYVIRFKIPEIFQHAVLMISFTLLALTGFALKFPDAWWVDMFAKLGISAGGRALLHRIAAVAFISISVYHLYYISFTKRGRYLFKQIMLRFSDIKEVIQTLKYYLYLSSEKPRYEEFDYTEKAEYWAVVWGGIVMGITGFVLWFPTIITQFAPSWVVRAAELIHFYEAILASLAIVVFHLFFVIFHPEQYPMNLSWLTGKMSLKAAVKKHPRWIERLLKEKKNLDLLPEVIQANCNTLADVENYLKFGSVYEHVQKGKVIY